MMLWRPLKQWFDYYFGVAASTSDKVEDKKQTLSTTGPDDSSCSSSCCTAGKPGATSSSGSAAVPAKDTAAYFKHSNKIQLEADMNFDDFIASEHPTLVKFTASWCKPCKQQEPEIVQLAESLAAEGSKMRFLSVDVDEHDELFSSLEIIGIPHIRIYQQSKVLETFSGRSTEALEKACRDLSKKNN